jgi:hypothetical protein
MARIDVSGADAFLAGLEDMVRDFPELRDAILEAEADIIEPALRASIANVRLVRDSTLMRSIKRRRGKSAGIPAIWIGPSGEHHRYLPSSGKTGVVSAGYVGYIGEYGITSRGIPGREWLKKGIERSQDAAFDAAEAVYDNHLKKNDL